MLHVVAQPQITVETTGFYRDGDRYYLILQEDSELLYPMGFSSLDPFHFETYVQKIELFTEQTWPTLKDSILGVCLFKGKLDFEKELSYEETPLFQEFCRNLSLPLKESLQLFRASSYAQDFHRLISYFPAETPIFVFLDVSMITSRPLLISLLNPSNWRHLHLVLKGSRAPLGMMTWQEGYPSQGWIGVGKEPKSIETIASDGIVWPEGTRLSLEIWEGLERRMQHLEKLGVSFRILPEELLAEMWNEIDTLHVMRKGMSGRGNRLIEGFLATGGHASEIT